MRKPCHVPDLQMVEQQFQHLFPDKVLRVHMAHDTREIDSLVSEYWKLRRRLLDLLDDYSNKRKHGRHVKPAQVRLHCLRNQSWQAIRSQGILLC